MPHRSQHCFVFSVKNRPPTTVERQSARTHTASVGEPQKKRPFGKRRSPRVGRDDNLYVEGAHERTRQRSTPHCASGSAASSSHLSLEMGGRAVFRICEVRCAAIWRRHSASTCARRDCNLLVRVACAAIWRRRSASTCARVSIHGYIGCNSASGRRSSAYGLPSEVRAVLKRTFAVRELAVMTVHSQPRPCCSEHR